MDIWMATVAQHFKNLKKDGDRITLESSVEGSDCVKTDKYKHSLGDKCPFRRLLKSEKLVENDFEAKIEVSNGVFSTEMASGSEFDGEKGLSLGDFEGSNVIYTSSSIPEAGCSYGFARNRSILRNRRLNRRSVRPLSSLESCLSAQLFNEQIEMEDYILGSVLKPVFVTDGSNVNSRESFGVSILQNETGIPPLPNIGFLKDSGTAQTRRLNYPSKTSSGKHANFQKGSSEMLLLCLGMSFGIMLAFLMNKREVENLNGLLKQTENLVQDLHDELEMKDSLIVQEITVEESMPSDNREFVDQKAKDESLSKIEAELEAELETLELNMSSSALRGWVSDLVELDLSYEPDLARGELRADMFGLHARDQPYADLDGSGTSPARSTNHAVCPRELSLRLHEVLESRLKDRIRELEAQIEKKWKPLQNDFENPKDEPVVLNLSGEALDDFNELPLEVGISDQNNNVFS